MKLNETLIDTKMEAELNLNQSIEIQSETQMKYLESKRALNDTI